MIYRTAVRIIALASCLCWPYSVGGPCCALSPPQAELLYTLGGGSPTWAIAFSPQGDLLATGSEDQTAKLWDLATGRLQRTLIGNAGTVGAVAFSPDGRTLAAGYAQGLVTLWNVPSGQPHDWLAGVQGPLAFSPDGRLLATTKDNQVKLWSTRSWKAVAILSGARVPPGPAKTSTWVWQMAFAPDGKSLATVQEVYSGGEMNPPADFVQLWDTTTWKVRRSLHQPIASEIQVAFAPDSSQLAVVGGWIDRGNILLWNRSSGKVRPLVSNLEQSASSIVYDPKGRWVAFASEAGVTFVDVASGKQLLVVDVGRAAFGSRRLLQLSPDGRLLAAIREDGAVEVWRLPAFLGAASAAAPAAGAAAPPQGRAQARGMGGA